MSTATASPQTTITRPSVDIAAQTVDLSRTYGEGDIAVSALDRVDLAFEAGRFTAIMGPSGSGKSTLMQCMAGLDRPSSGEVFIGDHALSALNDKQLTLLRRNEIGFVFQAFNLIPTLTAMENILLPLTLAGTKGDRAWIDHVIDAVGLRERINHRPSELSGGQQQRVAVARALGSRPQMVFADEPTGNLDSNSAAVVLGLLRQASREFGQSIAMVTHDPAAAAHADRAVFLADGRLAADITDPTVDSIFDAMRTLEA